MSIKFLKSVTGKRTQRKSCCLDPDLAESSLRIYVATLICFSMATASHSYSNKVSIFDANSLKMASPD